MIILFLHHVHVLKYLLQTYDEYFTEDYMELLLEYARKDVLQCIVDRAIKN
jgi:hypothetical protein